MGFNGSVDPRVNRLSSLWPIKSCLGRAVRCWSVDVVRHVGGEISSEISPCALRDLPHTYSCTCFYSTKQRWKQARTLPVVNTGESKLLLKLKKPKFLLFCFLVILFFYCFYIFFHGKLGMMGNLAGWKHDMRMHKL